jgi:3-hydroxybutyrate dehydrogenase
MAHHSSFSTAAPVFKTYDRLKDKVCVVTGGGAGLGYAIADRYAREGGKVVIADLNLEAAEKAAKELKGHGFPAAAVKVDITEEDQVKAMVQFAVATFGGIDVIVSNAGYQHIEPVDDLSLKEWRKMLAVHLDGSFLCTKYAMKEMKKNNKGGSIIFMGSVHSKLASIMKAPYVTAKHGLMGLSRTVAKEGAKHNIRANVICPGFVLTDLVRKQIPEQAQRLGITENEVIKNVMLKDTVDGEFTTPEDIAEVAVLFAAHPTAALTGQSLIASHGWAME